MPEKEEVELAKEVEDVLAKFIGYLSKRASKGEKVTIEELQLLKRLFSNLKRSGNESNICKVRNNSITSLLIQLADF